MSGKDAGATGMQFTEINGRGGEMTYVVDSKFKLGGGQYQVTMTLFSRRTQNTFYDKHVLREGESSRETWSDRRALLGGGHTDGAKMIHATDLGIHTGSTRSTFIRLKSLEFKEMIYGLAKALVENYQANAWTGVGNYQLHLPVEPVFRAPQSVVSFDAGGNKTYHRSIKIGGKLIAAAGNNITVDLNHCGGPGAT